MESPLNSRGKHSNSDIKSDWSLEKWKQEKDHKSKWWEQLKGKAAEWVKNQEESKGTKGSLNSSTKHLQVCHNFKKRLKMKWVTKSSKKSPSKAKFSTQNINWSSISLHKCVDTRTILIHNNMSYSIWREKCSTLTSSKNTNGGLLSFRVGESTKLAKLRSKNCGRISK